MCRMQCAYAPRMIYRLSGKSDTYIQIYTEITRTPSPRPLPIPIQRGRLISTSPRARSIYTHWYNSIKWNRSFLSSLFSQFSVFSALCSPLRSQRLGVFLSAQMYVLRKCELTFLLITLQAAIIVILVIIRVVFGFKLQSTGYDTENGGREAITEYSSSCCSINDSNRPEIIGR